MKKSSAGVPQLEGPSTPYLNSKPNLTSKELEIKKTIEAIAGPTGTIRLFPQSNPSPSSKSSEDQPSVTSVSDSSLLTASESEASAKPEFVKSTLQSVITPEKDVKPPKDGDDVPDYSLPKRSSTLNKPSSSLSQKHSTFTPAKEEEKPIYSLPKRSVPPIEPKSDPEEKPIYTLHKKPFPAPVSKQETEILEPLYTLPKKSTSPQDTKTSNSTVLLKKSHPSTPPLVAPKPRKLSAQYSVNSSKDSQSTNSEIEVPASLVEDVEPVKSETPKPVLPYSSSLSKTSVNNSSPVIISGKPSTAGLRKFQNTSEHNNHNQVATSVKGYVPLPGMSTNSPNSISVGSTLNSNKNSSPRSSFLATRPGPNFSPKNNFDLSPKAQMNPAGSFLATRSPSPVSRPKSPVRGGFVQSAMLKREGTLLRSRTGSTDSPPPLLNNLLADSRTILLANPVARTNSRSPSPHRGHARTQSTNSIERIAKEDEINFTGVLNKSSLSGNSQDSMQSRFLKLSVGAMDIPKSYSSDGINDLRGSESLNDLAVITSNSTDKDSSVNDIKGDSVIEDTSDLPQASETSAGTNSHEMTHKPSDSRRWSPVRSTWLESALKKTPSSPGGESINRSSTLVRPKPSIRAVPSSRTSTSSFIKPTPPTPPTKTPRLPTAVTLSEPSLPDDEDTDSFEEESKEQTSSPVITKKPAPPAPQARSLPRLTRSLSVKPSPPKKLELSQVPTDALEKLRQLRAGTLNRGSQESAKRDTVRSQNTPEEEKPSPPLPRRPESVDFTPKPLPPRPSISKVSTSVPRAPFPPVPPSLIPKSRSLNPEIPSEPLAMKFQPTPDDDSILENASIPNVISKRTAKTFASDLSAVLQRGKPLVPLEDTATSFSPRFERMTEFSGPKKSKTFDESILLPSNSSKQSQKKDLTHMTKSRAKGPKRRLPRTATLPDSSMSTPAPMRNKTHMRQRSRSLSPLPQLRPYSRPNGGQFQSASTTPVRNRSPSPPPLPSRRTDPDVNTLRGSLIVPKQRGFNPTSPSSTPTSVSKHDGQPSVTPGTVKGGVTSSLARTKPVIHTSSRVISEKLQKQVNHTEDLVPSKMGKPLPVPPKPRKLSVNISAQ